MKRRHILPRRVRRILHNLGWCRCRARRAESVIAEQELRLRAIEQAIERQRATRTDFDPEGR